MAEKIFRIVVEGCNGVLRGLRVYVQVMLDQRFWKCIDESYLEVVVSFLCDLYCNDLRSV